MLNYGTARSDFDFDGSGKRSGFIDVVHSDHDNAFSAIRVPVGMIGGVEGPTVLLSAGNHGDEYEGQVILHRLMQMLTPEQVRGRLIFLPALNTPAVTARTRVSPLDGGNMNRVFQNASASGPTAAIAGFVSTHLIPRADVILDFHAGGTTANYVDCGFLCIGPKAPLNEANLALAEAFGAPFTMTCGIDGAGGDFDTAAHLQETPLLSCELGGMGTFSPQSFKTGWEGALRVLRHVGCVTEAGIPDAAATRFIEASAPSGFATAGYHGLAELHVRIGQDVQKDDVLATLYDVHHFGEIRAELTAGHDGVVSICRRNPMVVPGDHLCLVSREHQRENLLNPPFGDMADPTR